MQLFIDPAQVGADRINADLQLIRNLFVGQAFGQEVEHSLFPRRAGSWPGVVFTGEPLKMAAGHFGVGRGGGAHAPDEWLLIDSKDPKVAGFERQSEMFVDYLYQVASEAKKH